MNNKIYTIECGFCSEQIEGTDEINEAINKGDEDIILDCGNCNCPNTIIIEYNEREEVVRVFNADSF